MGDSEGSWTSSAINEELRKKLKNSKSMQVPGLASQACIATNMPPKTNISFDGDAGDNLAGLNNGSSIVLNGNAGRFVGNGMRKGVVIVNGNCEEGVGHCSSGGTIVIQGSVEGSAGPSMKGGDLIISGSVGGDIATCMSGGTIIVCGDVAGYVGRVMTGGRVFLAGEFEDKEHLWWKIGLLGRAIVQSCGLFDLFLCDLTEQSFEEYQQRFRLEHREHGFLYQGNRGA